MAYASWSNPSARFSEDVAEPTTGTRSVVSERDDVEAYLPLVRRLACRVHRKVPPNVLLDDLVSAGTLGLLDALRRFDGVRDARFEWYLHVRIRGAILDELRRLDWLSRRQRAALTSDSNGQIAIVALDELPEHHRDLASARAASPADLTEQHLHGVALAAAVGRLPEREQTIVSMHYYQEHTLKEIAGVIGVSEARVSQLHARALTLLQGLMSPTGAA